jgi:hypothetical protein
MTTDDKDFSEKRDYRRMFFDAPVLFMVGDTQDWQKGLAKDLSAGGLSFITDVELAEGASVVVKLEPITPVTPPLEAKVTIIRSVENEQGQFDVSSKIEEILN